MSKERDGLERLMEAVLHFQDALKDIGLGEGALEVRISDMLGRKSGRHFGRTDAQVLEMALMKSPSYFRHMGRDPAHQRPRNLIAEVCGVKFTRFRVE